MSTAITEREGKLASLLDHSDRLAANLAEKDESLVRLIDASKTLLDFLVLRREQLATALGEGSEAVASLSRLIEANRVHLDAILDDLGPTLATVDANLPDLNRALAIVGPAFLGQAAGRHPRAVAGHLHRRARPRHHRDPRGRHRAGRAVSLRARTLAPRRRRGRGGRSSWPRSSPATRRS